MTERLAVLGSPIAHSQSPALHLAAYAALGLDWEYSRVEITEPELAGFLSGAGRELRGCSATMPLKQELVRLASWVDPVAELTGAANTAVGMREGSVRVYNTDVIGIIRALRNHGVDSPRSALILGAGATASSALVALAELGVGDVTIRTRRPSSVGRILDIAQVLSVHVTVEGLDPALAGPPQPADVLVSTLPAGALDAHVMNYAECAAVALDVSYDPWPSTLAAASAPGAVFSGLEMLLEQALIQVRIFVGNSPSLELPNEALVRAAMRKALPGLWED